MENSKTGVKHDQGKADLSLIPYSAMIAEAQALMVGERKYGRYNYENGMEVTRIMSALLRHAYAYLNGEENDPVDGQPHLGSIRACTSMIIRSAELGTLIDNRSPNRVKNEKE
jgi:hypothetical protein